MVGDNIYHYDLAENRWHQVDSHHSNADGSVNPHNLRADTKADKVLASRHFYYFGREAPIVPRKLLNAIGYKNGRNYRVLDCSTCAVLIDWLEGSFRESLDEVRADPFDFNESEKRYSARDNRIT